MIGCAPPYPSPGWPTSSYLVESPQGRLLLDCGHGAAQELLKHCALEDVSGIVISHLHPDHWFDLAALRNVALHRGITGLEVAVPVGGLRVLRAVGAALDQGEDYFESLLHICEYDQRPIDFAGYTLSGEEAVHQRPARMPTLTTTDGARLVFTGDTGSSPPVVAATAGANLLIAECNDVGPRFSAGRTGHHLDAVELAALVEASRPARLLVTHYDVEHASTIDRELQGVRPETLVVLAEPGTVLPW